jgi:hypothetical protein
MSRQKGTPKTGGRKKGTPNKKTILLQEIIAASGVTPLDYMLRVLRDENATAMERMDAAKAAAPYVHARLAAIEHAGNEVKPMRMVVVWGGNEAPSAGESMNRSETAAGPTWRSRKHPRQPLTLPAQWPRPYRLSWGRPSCRPSSLARASPARTRS